MNIWLAVGISFIVGVMISAGVIALFGGDGYDRGYKDGYDLGFFEGLRKKAKPFEGMEEEKCTKLYR